jgi:hypothetical protein
VAPGPADPAAIEKALDASLREMLRLCLLVDNRSLTFAAPKAHPSGER